jgi:hypothetical protein
MGDDFLRECHAPDLCPGHSLQDEGPFQFGVGPSKMRIRAQSHELPGKLNLMMPRFLTLSRLPFDQSCNGRVLNPSETGHTWKMTIGLFLILFISKGALASPACQNPIHHDALDSLAPFHRSAIIGKKDNRETYEEYAANPFRGMTVDDVYNEFSATGAFNCGARESANIVLRKNLLVLNAHAFYKSDGSCTPKFNGDFSECYFEKVDRNGVPSKRKYKIRQETLKVGTKCPADKINGNDWAVVEIEEEVEGVQPYAIVDVRKLGGTRNNDYEALLNLKTTSAVADNSNLKGHSPRTPTICDGMLGGIQSEIDPQTRGTNYFQVTNCSSGLGNSGGAVLLRKKGSVPALIGIISGTVVGKKYDHVPFGPKNYTPGPLIEGKLYETLMEMQSDSI